MASLIANAVGKNLVGGPRPLLDDVPIGRQLRRQPRSASFPSGHTASAIAFVTGVALESPRTGLVLAPLAAAVSYSRLKVGAHWLSDVVGGALLGAGVAVAGRLVLPVPAHPVGPAALAGEPIGLPASSRGEGVLVVSNGASGAARRRDPVTLLRKRLPEARYRSLGDTDLGEMVAAELRRRNPPRVLAVVGGDGTVETAARVALEHDLPLLVVPGGTFDHFSRAVGTDSVETAVAALAAGTGARVDVAAVDVDGEPHHLAINATALGVYADYLAERDRLEGRLGKRVAGLVSGVQILRRGRTVTFERDGDAVSRGGAGAASVGATVDGGAVRQGAARTAWSVFVGVGRNDDDVVSPMRRRALDDGSLEVRTLSSGSRLGRIGALSSLAFGPRSTATLRLLGLLPEKEAFSTEVTSRFAVTVAGALRPAIAHDGEGDTSLPDTAERDGYRYEVRLLPRALRVYRPRG
nr:bifunctional phosphatase PAP2/diacylglycerol kinase family protein [Frigoribacterium sp. CFBP 13712]